MKLVTILIIALFGILALSLCFAATSLGEIIITDADTVWAPVLVAADSDITDSSDAPSFPLPGIFISHADTVWQPELIAAPSEAQDSTDASPPNLPDVFISYADTVWASILTVAPSGIEDSSDAPPSTLSEIFVSHADTVWNSELEGWAVPENQPPDQPINISPPDGALNINPNSYQLVASDFSDSDPGDTHYASQWQVREASESYNNPVFDTYTNNPDHLTKTSIPLPDDPEKKGKLNYDSTYYWRVRYKDNHDAWSEWSDETFFTTIEFTPFTFAHIADVHIGWDPEKEILYWSAVSACQSLASPILVDECVSEKKQERTRERKEELDESVNKFTETLQNIKEHNPSFLLISGDNVEWSEKEFFQEFLGSLESFHQQYGIPYYVVPGNHDRYGNAVSYLFETFIDYVANDFLQNYHDIMGNPSDLKRPDEKSNVSILDPFELYKNEKESKLEGINRYNYKFEHNGYLFIGLDTGEDDDLELEDAGHHLGFEDLGPEGSGLSDLHMDALDRLDKSIPKIFFLHHPIYTSADGYNLAYDGEYIDSSIMRNHVRFTDYCKTQENNVKLVLSGHSHEDHIFDRDGTKASEWPITLGSPNILDWDGEPLFIQTPSATKNKKEGSDTKFQHGYRIIDVREDWVDPRPYEKTIPLPKNTMSTIGPVHTHVYDSQGRHTGFGSIIVDIPDSYYTGYYGTSTPQMIILYNTSEDYEFEVAGIDEGTYKLNIESMEEGEATSFTAIDIPTTASTTHQYTIDWGVLSRGEKGVTLQIDADGDGVFEETITSDNELTQDEFILQTETIIDCDPNTLNLKSNGQWITCYIELPDGPRGQEWDVWQIDGSTILLNGVIPAYLGKEGWAKKEANDSNIMDSDGDGILERMVKFDRATLQAVLAPGEAVILTLAGKLFYNTVYNAGLVDFEGFDSVAVADKPVKVAR